MPALTPSSEDVRIYECCILYPYPLDQKAEADLLKEVEGLFAEAGGKQVAKDAWGRRGIAYPIKGAMEGSYVVYYYEMDPAKLKEVDQALKIMKNLSRHLIVKPPKGYLVTKYSEVYATWIKERETIDQRKSREQEEKVQTQVAERAKRQVKRAATEKKPEEKAAPMQQEVLTEKLEKLISDDSLDL